jgi:hypothetical protein
LFNKLFFNSLCPIGEVIIKQERLLMNTIHQVLFISMVFIITPVSVAESGLLLGLRHGSHYNVSSVITEEKNVNEGKRAPSFYRTFWIRADNGQVKLAAEKTNLLVPRSDGFWRIDVKHSTYNDFTEDFVWINPASDPDDIPNPFLAEEEGIDAFDVSLLVKKQGVDSMQGEYCKGYASRDILSVGDNHLSIGYSTNKICQSMDSTTDSTLQMLSLEQLEPVEIMALLKASARNAFKKTTKKHQYKNQGIEEWGEVSGGIVRHQGRWIIKGHLPIIGKGYTHFDVPIAPPKSLVSDHKLYPDWRTIKKNMPNVVDAFSSLAQDLLVVLTDTGYLLAFNIKEGKISKEPALHILFKQPVTVVMARWAEGQYVSNWTEEIHSLSPKPQKSWFVPIEMPSLEEVPKTIGIVVTQSTTLNIRQGIGEHTKPIAKVKKGSTINVLDVLGQWYKVQLDNELTGYAHSDYVKVLPKLPYIQKACLIDNCTYGQWKLKKYATLYASPSSKADSLATLKANQMVRTLHGEVHTSQFGEIEVIKSQVELTDDNKTLTLQRGDRLFDLEAVGLGMHVVWYNGELYYLNNGWDSKVVSEDALWGNLITQRKTNWWVKIAIPERNLIGWIMNP